MLVNMRARLARSDRPDRIFEVVLEVARRAGLVGRKLFIRVVVDGAAPVPTKSLSPNDMYSSLITAAG
ncbi:hypothetical protein B0I31_10973 [Saccharothrix carnea]|uniref:Uncharacterized protein n=1 Tax=Saccharothrix carnea TaxID=1280637 RepID=A0A2P8I491_SACCR|nr:hypothetical protein B0I31_10973 [Saccharothrix carnea]